MKSRKWARRRRNRDALLLRKLERRDPGFRRLSADIQEACREIGRMLIKALEAVSIRPKKEEKE